MKCFRCERPLTKPALTMSSKRGTLYLGPHCAKYVQPVETRTGWQGIAARAVRRVVEVDPQQMTMEFA